MKSQIDELLDSLSACDHVYKQVNKHVAHTVNPQSPNFVEWKMGLKHLEESQEAICRAAIRLERDILKVCNRIEIIPVQQDDYMQDLRLWVPEQLMSKLYQFWHDHIKRVNSWKGQLQSLFACADPEIVPLYAIAAFAGVRWNEIEQLNWDDIKESEIVISAVSRKLVPVVSFRFGRH